MSNEWYDTIGDLFAGTGLNYLSGNIKSLLCSASYTPDTSDSGDKFVADVPSGAILARSGNFTGKSVTGRVLDAATWHYSLAGPVGAVGKYVIVYIDLGADATSRLMLKFDTGNNLPVTLNGADVAVQTGATPNKLGEM